MREGAAWHWTWLAAVAVAGAAIAAALGGMPWTQVAAMVAAAAPAAAGAVLGRRRLARTRMLLVAGWALGGGLACVLGGGVSGPTAVWCLAPVAAATILGSGRLVAQAAALAVTVAAIAALAQVAGVVPAAPPTAYAFWIGLTAQLTTAVGIAAGLLASHQRATRDQATAKASYAALERLLTQQPNLIVSLDPDGTVRSAFGYAPEGAPEALLLDHGLIAAAEPADRPSLAAALAAALSDGRGEAVFTPLGSPRSVCMADLIRAVDGGLVAVLRDGARQRSREAALEAAKQEAEALNAGKSRFLANMSHELRTPLNAVIGFSDMMRARLFGPLPARYGEYAELIHESGGHLLDLINDVLDMSKIEADHFQLSREIFDLRDAVSAALRLLRQQADDAGIALRGVLPSYELPIDADKRAIKQIVLNLVSNALKFTPRGGQVTVTVNHHEQSVDLVVADTGVGIAEDDLKRIGRPYEQAGDADQRAEGSGLGLSLVRAFAELHEGDMIIESALGEGTSVTVRLPAMAAERPSAKVIAFAPQH